MTRVVRCGDAALTVHFDERPSATLARRIAALQHALRCKAPAGFVESVPGLTTLTVLLEPSAADPDEIERHIHRCVTSADATPRTARQWHVPVCYEGECAPDLESFAASCRLAVHEVVAAHTARRYTVYLLGFSPGFPYMGDLDPRLTLPRRTEPRLRVPAGSVAVADRYTAVYPQSTPGGWHLLGRTPARLFEVDRAPPALFAAGDEVMFEAVTRNRYDALEREFANGRVLEPA